MHSPAMTRSLGQLFSSEADRVFGFLLARCGSRALAEDLTAETFMDAGRRLANDGDAEITRSWLFTVARRRLIDHWRSEGARARRMERLRSEARRVAPSDDGDVESDVAAALDSLSERYRAALVLRYIEDFSVAEIADALEVTYKAAESLLGRARESFARAYKEMER